MYQPLWKVMGLSVRYFTYSCHYSGVSQCPLFGVERLPYLGKYISKIKRLWAALFIRTRPLGAAPHQTTGGGSSSSEPQTRSLPNGLSKHLRDWSERSFTRHVTKIKSRLSLDKITWVEYSLAQPSVTVFTALTTILYLFMR